MTIQFVLMENHLTSDPSDYMARVISTGTAEFEDLVNDIIKGGSTVTRPDILAVLDAYHRAITSRLREGFRVLTPVTNFSVTIQGRFEGISDSFDPSRHLIQPNCTPSATLRRSFQDGSVSVTKQETSRADPNPEEFYDFTSESKNGVVTPGGPARLIGHRLKFDPSDSRQGIFFIAADGSETRVAMMMRNKPAELMFMIPSPLASGDYTIEVRTITTKDDKVRQGTLREVVSVP